MPKAKRKKRKTRKAKAVQNGEEVLASPTSDKAWQDEETFTGVLIDIRDESLPKGDEATVLAFDVDGAVLERWSTKKWDDLIEDEKVDVGDCLRVNVHAEQKLKKGGRRFRPFEIVKLTGKAIPKRLRKRR